MLLSLTLILSLLVSFGSCEAEAEAEPAEVGEALQGDADGELIVAMGERRPVVARHAAPQAGADGEYCYDPSSGYNIDFTNRVNNNRVVLVSTDNPNQRTSLGFGRVRKEEGDLRDMHECL